MENLYVSVAHIFYYIDNSGNFYCRVTYIEDYLYLTHCDLKIAIDACMHCFLFYNNNTFYKRSIKHRKTARGRLLKEACRTPRKQERPGTRYLCYRLGNSCCLNYLACFFTSRPTSSWKEASDRISVVLERQRVSGQQPFSTSLSRRSKGIRLRYYDGY